jgi:hypothetical protein
VTAIFRSFAVTLALSAMLLRAVLPAGWMPNLAGAGDASLVICSVDGAHHLPSHDPAHGQQDDHMCPFAAAAHLAPPQLPPAILQPFAVAWLAPHFAESLATFRLHDSGHAPRGPPVSI